MWQYMTDFVSDYDNIDYDKLIQRFECFTFTRLDDGSILAVDMPYRKFIDQYIEDWKQYSKEYELTKAKRKFFQELDKDFTNGTFEPEEYVQKWKEQIQPLQREI